MNVSKKMEKIKKELHYSFDVTSRLLTKNGDEVGFIYLKSFTDNLIFSSAIYEPISKCESLTFENIKNIIKSNDIKDIKEL